MTKEIERQVNSMCNLSEGIYRTGESNGIKQGRIQTIAMALNKMDETSIKTIFQATDEEIQAAKQLIYVTVHR